jgi:hypothetical protein
LSIDVLFDLYERVIPAYMNKGKKDDPMSVFRELLESDKKKKLVDADPIDMDFPE